MIRLSQMSRTERADLPLRLCYGVFNLFVSCVRFDYCSLASVELGYN
jgi:hypothetical protein